MCLAIPGQIVGWVPDEAGTVLVDISGVRRKVDTRLLEADPPALGDWVLIHVGFAMCKISETEAAEQIRTLVLLGEHDTAVEQIARSGLDDDGPSDRGGRS